MKQVMLFLALVVGTQSGCTTAQNMPSPLAATVASPASNPSTTIAEMAADTAVRKAQLAKISGLVGSWAGPGWRVLPSGERIEYDQRVLVTSKMGGHAFTIEGASVRRPQTGPPGSGSLAVITWEPSENRYAFRSFTGGRLIDADGVLTNPDTFVWIVKGPPLALRFTVKFNGDVWSEVGEVSRDGEKTWVVTYQLEMHKSPLP